MGEIDTKSIESVQAALSLFEKSGNRKNWSGPGGDYDMEKEKDIEGLLQDLANCKVQLEAQESAHKQALLKLDHFEETVDGLSTLLKNSELDREACINDCREARMRVVELEARIKEMTNKLSENGNTQEQLSHIINKLKSTQEELLSAQKELTASREAKLEAMRQAEIMETALNMEKESLEGLVRHVSELNETILHLKLASIEAVNEKCTILSEKESKLQLACEKVVEVEEEMLHLREELEMMKSLESQLLAKSIFIDSLHLELQQVNELRSFAEQAASDAVNDMNQLKETLQLQEKENLNLSGYIDSLGMELKELRLELKNANDEVHRMSSDVESVTGELGRVNCEMNVVSRKENEAQIEIALLKAELHKERSKTAAAEAAAERAKSDKSSAYVALQQLAIEADEAKKETRRLKSENSASDQVEEEEEEIKDDTSARVITISAEEYKILLRKAEMADDNIPQSLPESTAELEIVKRELEAAMVKIWELRTRAEHAVTRAEAAELSKAGLEAQIKRWRERKERRKAALVALQEESISRENYSFKYDDADTPKTYVPLSKLLKSDA